MVDRDMCLKIMTPTLKMIRLIKKFLRIGSNLRNKKKKERKDKKIH